VDTRLDWTHLSSECPEDENVGKYVVRFYVGNQQFDRVAAGQSVTTSDGSSVKVVSIDYEGCSASFSVEGGQQNTLFTKEWWEGWQHDKKGLPCGLQTPTSTSPSMTQTGTDTDER